MLSLRQHNDLSFFPELPKRYFCRQFSFSVFKSQVTSCQNFFCYIPCVSIALSRWPHCIMVPSTLSWLPCSPGRGGAERSGAKRGRAGQGIVVVPPANRFACKSAAIGGTASLPAGLTLIRTGVAATATLREWRVIYDRTECFNVSNDSPPRQSILMKIERVVFYYHCLRCPRVLSTPRLTAAPSLSLTP